MYNDSHISINVMFSINTLTTDSIFSYNHIRWATYDIKDYPIQKKVGVTSLLKQSHVVIHRKTLICLRVPQADCSLEKGSMNLCMVKYFELCSFLKTFTLTERSNINNFCTIFSKFLKFILKICNFFRKLKCLYERFFNL